MNAKIFTKPEKIFLYVLESEYLQYFSVHIDTYCALCATNLTEIAHLWL